MTLQIISLAASIICPVVTALVMWGYRSDQRGIKEGITKNTVSIEKEAARQTERMDKMETNFNDLKSELPHVYVLREDFIRTLNNVDKQMNSISGKLDMILHSKARED